MAEAAPKPGPSESMEDILQSIKRIIEDDSVTEAKAEAAEAGDVLDLTQMVRDDNSVTSLAPLPKAGATPLPDQDIVKSIDAIFANDAPIPVAETVYEPAPVKLPPEPVAHKPFEMEEGLVSDAAANAAAAALRPIVDSGIKDYSIPHIQSAQLRNGNTVEDLVLEALRPMLKAWLDEHLPTIVQKIVEKEVKRIVTFHHE